MMRVVSALLLLVSVLAMPAQAQLAAVGGGSRQAATFVGQYKTILPHVVFGGGWHNRFVFVNYNGTTASVRLYFYGNGGSALTVPIKQFGTAATYVDVYLQGWGTRVIETNESSGDALQQGWAKAVVSCTTTPCEDVIVYGVFATAEVPGYPVFEATVFAGDSRSTMAMFPFDNRDGFVTGIAIVAHTCTATDPNVRINFKYGDDPGNTFYQFQVPMTCPGHTSFSLPAFNSLSQNQLGFVEVFSHNASVSAIALLFNPKGGAHTTIPPSEYIPTTP
jgi:hypothetical protein